MPVLSLLTEKTCPEMLNILSTAADEAGTAKNFLANKANTGSEL